MIVTHGGLEGGYGLYLRDGKPTFVYNFLALDRPTFAAKDPLPKGKTKLVVDFAYDGGGMGKGGDDHHDGRWQDDRRRPDGKDRSRFSSRSAKGLDIGMDVGSPVDFTYELPFAFTGKIEKVEDRPQAIASVIASDERGEINRAGAQRRPCSWKSVL